MKDLFLEGFYKSTYDFVVTMGLKGLVNEERMYEELYAKGKSKRNASHMPILHKF